MLAAENTLISKIEGLENNLFRMQQDILTLEDNISQILVILDTLSTWNSTCMQAADLNTWQIYDYSHEHTQRICKYLLWKTDARYVSCFVVFATVKWKCV